MTVVDLSLAAPPDSSYQLDQMLELLNTDERARSARFRRHEDRRTFITAHALTRLALSRHHPAISPSERTFEIGPWGRPQPTNPDIGKLQVNLSHTSEMAAVVVADAIEIGVDVEYVTPDDWIYETINTVLSTDESTSLLRLDEESRRERFFLYWTLKESYIKARGMGISLPLTKISFAGSNSEGVVLDIEPEIDDNPTGWQFALFHPSPTVRGAVAARTGELDLQSSWPTLR
jgi:4'-phosphopantetheinyl transferase